MRVSAKRPGTDAADVIMHPLEQPLSAAGPVDFDQHCVSGEKFIYLWNRLVAGMVLYHINDLRAAYQSFYKRQALCLKTAAILSSNAPWQSRGSYRNTNNQ